MKKIFILLFIVVGGVIYHMLFVKYGSLLEVVYSSSGDMNGNVNMIIMDARKLTIRREYSPSHDIPIQVKEYQILKEEVSEIKKMISMYRLLSFSKLPMGDLFAYDAPTTTLSFYYDNSKVGGDSFESYSVNYYMKLSNSQREKLRKVTRYMNSLMKEERFISSYTK